MQRAACRDVGKRPIFVMDQAAERHTPSSVVACFACCRGCPVRREFLEDALGEDEIEVVGVWGGTTTLERREARYLVGNRGKLRGRRPDSTLNYSQSALGHVSPPSRARRHPSRELLTAFTADIGVAIGRKARYRLDGDGITPILRL
jgi:hypothetical protein